MAGRRSRLLVNYRSGRNARNPGRRAALVEAFSALGEVAQIEGEEGLGVTLRRWKAEGVDLLAISGGDGTMQRALVHLQAIWRDEQVPDLLLLHGGTSGLVPRSAGIRDSVRAVTHLREATEGGAPLEVRPFRTLMIGDRPAFTVGIGAFHRVAAHYVERGRRGEADHGRIGLRLFGSCLVGGPFAKRILEPLDYGAQLDELEFAPGELIGMHISSLDRFLLRTYGRIDLRDDGLRVVALRGMSRGTTLRGLLSMGTGLLPLPSAMDVRTTPAVTLLPRDGPIAYMADGEFYEADGPLVIRPGFDLPVVRI